MAELKTCPPLTPSSIRSAHAKIKSYIHRTPVLTCQTLDSIASSSNPQAWLDDDPPDTLPSSGSSGNHVQNGTSDSLTSQINGEASPNFRLYFKAENYQKIGAFKARGAYHALTRLIDEIGIEEVRRKGVITHSSGNHAQALALAAHTFSIPAYIVMPSISTPSKIAGTKRYTQHVIFSGSTSTEREAVVAEVQAKTGAILVPPYDHPDIILGQGTAGLEMDEQLKELRRDEENGGEKSTGEFDVVIAPIGGGGLLGGIATYFSDSLTRVVGAEPSFQGADDAGRGVKQGKRIEHVKTLTIADGLRTPVGVVNWDVVSNPKKVEGLYAVSEDEIKMAMRLVFERMKVVVEPSAVVGLAVVLFNEEFRSWVVEEQQREKRHGTGDGVWDVGLVFSGGNTTMKAITALFGDEKEVSKNEERAEGKVGRDGQRKAEDIAG